MQAPKDLQSRKSVETAAEPVYYLEAANGMTVRVPQSRLEDWQAEQDKQRQGVGRKLTPEERQFAERILAQIYGSKK